MRAASKPRELYPPRPVASSALAVALAIVIGLGIVMAAVRQRLDAAQLVVRANG